MKSIYFTPGPSEMHYQMPYFFKQALKDEVFTLSHRSRSFTKIYKDVIDKLKYLFQIPDNYSIFFTYSSYEIMEKLAYELINESCCHLITGKYSEKFYHISKYLGKSSKIIKGDNNNVPDLKNILMADHYDAVSLTINDISNGVNLPIEYVKKLKNAFPESLMLANATSAFPIDPEFFNYLDSCFWDLQYGWGIPSGLALWIINDKVLDRVKRSKKYSNDSINSIINYYHKASNYQTPNVPNVFGLYLLSKVLEDYVYRGMDAILRDTNYKAALLYNLLDHHDKLKAYVANKECRSRSVITAKTLMPSNELMSYLADKNLVVEKGFREYKFKHIRIANYPLHSKEQFELLVDTINNFYEKN